MSELSKSVLENLVPKGFLLIPFRKQKQEKKMLQNRKKINIVGFHLPNFNKKNRGISMDRKMLYFFYFFNVFPHN